jgi:hypothetical protein
MHEGLVCWVRESLDRGRMNLKGHNIKTCVLPYVKPPVPKLGMALRDVLRGKICVLRSGGVLDRPISAFKIE